MAKFVFKLKGLGVEPDVVRTYTISDGTVTRALDKVRQENETNPQLLARLWLAFITENIVNGDYVVRQDEAVLALVATINKAVPTVETTET